jgi:diguanylate cyclase (GGDEF)-like protein
MRRSFEGQRNHRRPGVLADLATTRNQEEMPDSARVAAMPRTPGSAPASDVEPSTRLASSLRLARVRVAVVATLVGGAAVLAMFLVLPHAQPFDTEFDLPWPLLAVGFFVAEWKVIHVHFRRETHAFSMSEVPVVAGLFLLYPNDYLLAAVIGSGAALLVGGTRSPLKILYNLCHFAFVGILTLTIFQLITDHAAPPTFVDWLAALAATSASAVVSAVSVATVITASGGAPQFNKLPEMIRFSGLMAVANTSITLLAITVMWEDPTAVALLGLPVLALFFVYRAYLGEKEKHQRLELLYQSSRIMHHTPELDSAILAVLEHAREMFRAEVAEILLFPRVVSEEALRTVAYHDRPSDIMTPVAFDPNDMLVQRCAREGRALFVDDARGGSGAQDMLSPLSGDSGVFGLMRVSHRLSAGTGFDEDDLRLLETLANQAAVALENGHLEQSLAELSRLKEQLRFQAYHDPLTGLPNRTLLIEAVDERLAAAAGATTVLYIDLDDFKYVNDSLGHAAGDRILVAAAERIRSCLAPGDVAARLGGDEFAILLAAGAALERPAVAGDEILAALRAPFALNGQELTIGGSIGVATAREGQSADDLLRDADVAMYAAKSGGKRRVSFFDPSMHAALVQRHKLSGELARSVDRGELQVHYQPILELATGRVVGAEALARWYHPAKGFVAPETFIALAEENGSILGLGRFVLAESISRAGVWRRLPGVEPDFRVSVNVSPLQLLQVDFVREVAALLGETGLPPEALILEMTETVLLRDMQPTLDKLRDLKDLGVALSLDDFGTGYSSLGYLRRFPVDMLKIAREFVPSGDSAGSESDWAVAATIVALGRTMSLRIVAEGIEELGQLERLTAMGCELGQGYLFLRPCDAAAFERYLGQGTINLGRSATPTLHPVPTAGVAAIAPPEPTQAPTAESTAA